MLHILLNKILYTVNRTKFDVLAQKYAGITIKVYKYACRPIEYWHLHALS